VIGRISADVSGPGGSIIDIGWDERLLDNTSRPLPYPGSLHPQWNQTDSWILDSSKRSISTIDARAGRYILLEVWGNGRVTFENIKVHEERYPLVKGGSFSSSDPILDNIWQLGVDTLYSNLTDAYADPWRERGQWWGDAYVITQTSNLVFGEKDLLKRGIILMKEGFTNGRPNALSPNGNGSHMLDYGMLWVNSVADYIQSSGDSRILENVYPTIIDFMEYLFGYIDYETGLLDIPPGHVGQTIYIDSGGGQSREGKSTAINAMYYETLLIAANMSDMQSDFENAQIWRHKAGIVRTGINQYLYNVETHQYYSSIVDGKFVPPSPHAQAWPLAYDVVPPHEINNVADSLLGLISMDPTLPDFELYGTYWILRALGRAGYINEAVDLIKIYYGHLLNSGATTTWEIYNAHKRFTQSLSHGWGSSPTWFLTTYLLGVELSGQNSWQITPSIDLIDDISGSVPIEDGIVHVSWQNYECGNFQINVSSPDSSKGVIVLSNTNNITGIEKNSEVIWEVGKNYPSEMVVENSTIRVYLSGGDHDLSVDRDCPAANE
jgi:alpha-L-rhamnosidase